MLRMYAFTYLPRRAITDDAYEYNYIAQNISKAIKDVPLEDNDKFLYFGAKRGWLYSLFIAVIYKIFGPDALYVTLVQVLIDSLTCILIYSIGKGLFNKKVGVIAAFLSSFYPAFPYYSTMLFQETTTIFLLTLYVLLLCKAISQNKPLYYFASGILVTIISFYRSGFLFFSLLTTPVLFLTLWFFYKKNFFHYFLCFLTGSICMLILYGALSYKVSGTFTFNKPSIAWSFYETSHRDGWPSDTFAPTPTKELNEVAQAYSYPIPVGSQTLSLPPKIYLKAGIRYILKNPSEYLSQLIKRLKRMWTYVETYPERWHSKRVWVQLVFHRCLLLLALVGIPLSITVWHHSWLFYLIILYVTVAYIPTIGLPRYGVPAMPFIIILAAYAASFIIDILKHNIKPLISLKSFLLLITAATLTSIVYYLDIPNLLALFPQASPTLCYKTSIILMNLLLITVAYGGYHLLNLRFKGMNRSLYVVAFPLVMVMLFYNNQVLTSKTWHEWETPLYSTHQKIKQTILVPDDLNPDDYRKANLMIDMFAGGGRDYNFKVWVNGQQLKVFEGGIKTREKKFDNKFFGFYKSILFDAYKLSPEDLRQWYEITLPLHFLKTDSAVVIECYLSGITDRKNNFVIVFGDYTTSIDENHFEGPCFPRSDLDTSLIKIMPYSGDYRFERVTTLNSKKTTSEDYNGFEWQQKDLSSLRGIQSGSYRIRIELIGKDGSQVIL